jgi:hypothetical protein
MPTHEPFGGTHRHRRAWALWGLVSLSLAGYAVLAQIASHTVATKVQLGPANAVELKLFRLFDDTLRFDLVFRAKGCEQRPELGSWALIEKDGLLTLRPGAEVRIEASLPSSPPVQYEAMPLSAHCSDGNVRQMTANLSVQPGVYRWPPPSFTPTIHLHPGYNVVRFEVTSVDNRIVGETVDLVVPPPLGFKSGQTSVIWLWFGLLWPVFVVVQSIWAAGLVFYRPRTARI